MIPKSGNISASSLNTWEECQAKFVADQVLRVDDASEKIPAKTGTADHYACQHFVNAVYFDKTHQWDDIVYLEYLYEQGYFEAFGTFDKKDKPYKDGLALIRKWHKRTDLSGITILSTERKDFYNFRDLGGGVEPATGIDLGEGIELRLTYIFDRCDYFEENGKKILRVVDYKSIQKFMGAQDVKDMLQANIYALAAAIHYKDLEYDEIRVALDMLRYDGLVGSVWTREDITEIWKYLVRTAHKIYNTPEDKVQPTLGNGCRYCSIKLECKARQENLTQGGISQIISEANVEELVSMRSQLGAQVDANRAIMEQLDSTLLDIATKADITSMTAGDFKVSVTSKGTRTVTDPELAAKIIGPDLMARVGKLNIGDIDKMIKDGMLTADQQERLETVMGKKYSDPKVSVGAINPIKKK